MAIVAACILCNAVYAGQYVWVDYVALIPQWLFVFPILLLLGTLWGVFHRWWARMLALVIVVAISWAWVQSLDVVWRNEVTAEQPLLTVMSWNTAQWNPGRRDDFIALLKAHPSDIYLLQEVSFIRNPDLHGYMLENFGEYQAGHYGEFFTLSKYPLNCNVSERTGVLLGCTALTPHGAVTLVNVHLKRPFHVTNFRTFEDFETRWRQFEALQNYLAQVTGPVIIAGDFNTTANYTFIEQLAGRFEKNNPIGTMVWPHTFPTNFPYMRIDYQFSSDHFQFCGYEEVKQPDQSDHVGIVGTLCPGN